MASAILLARVRHPCLRKGAMLFREYFMESLTIGTILWIFINDDDMPRKDSSEVTARILLGIGAQYLGIVRGFFCPGKPCVWDLALFLERKETNVLHGKRFIE
jgi:hypothetical protein